MPEDALHGVGRGVIKGNKGACLQAISSVKHSQEVLGGDNALQLHVLAMLQQHLRHCQPIV